MVYYNVLTNGFFFDVPQQFQDIRRKCIYIHIVSRTRRTYSRDVINVLQILLFGPTCKSGILVFALRFTSRVFCA